jgi:hypothetical protein
MCGPSSTSTGAAGRSTFAARRGARLGGAAGGAARAGSSAVADCGDIEGSGADVALSLAGAVIVSGVAGAGVAVDQPKGGAGAASAGSTVLWTRGSLAVSAAPSDAAALAGGGAVARAGTERDGAASFCAPLGAPLSARWYQQRRPLARSRW